MLVDTTPVAVGPSRTERTRRTAVAWERFVAGDDDVPDVPPVILLSWHRSRDVYRVDPLHTTAPPSGGAGTGSLLQDSVLTQLGGSAAALAAGADDVLTTVTDGCGRVLGSWGTSEVRRRASASNLAPLFTWSEPATGTNGMGTALDRTGPVAVRGPEHWCAGLHGWSCNGIAVRDPETRTAVAVLNVSVWGGDLPAGLAARLEREVAPLQRALDDRATHGGEALAAAFAAAARGLPPGCPLLAVDTAGRVVAADERSRLLDHRLPARPAVLPGERCEPEVPDLRDVVARAVGRAQVEPAWTGVAHLDLAGGETTMLEVRPVRSAHGVAGMLLVGAVSPDGEDLGPGDRTPRARVPQRVAGLRDGRLIVLAPAEIRYAEADRHAVWLVTDRGRVRSDVRGLDHVERDLAPFGFVRVHRSYLVNVHRIREIDQGLRRGTLTVSTQHHGREAIPVARRHAAQLRRRLGI